MPARVFLALLSLFCSDRGQRFGKRPGIAGIDVFDSFLKQAIEFETAFKAVVGLPAENDKLNLRPLTVSGF